MRIFAPIKIRNIRERALIYNVCPKKVSAVLKIFIRCDISMKVSTYLFIKMKKLSGYFEKKYLILDVLQIRSFFPVDSFPKLCG